MKKRHMIKMVLLILLLLIPWIFTFLSFNEKKYIKENEKDYSIVNARVESIDRVGYNDYRPRIQFDYVGKSYNTYVDLDLFDYFRDTITVAIHNQTGEVVRVDLAIPLWQWACSLGAIGFLLNEHQNYEKQKYLRAERILRHQFSRTSEEEDTSVF